MKQKHLIVFNCLIVLVFIEHLTGVVHGHAELTDVNTLLGLTEYQDHLSHQHSTLRKTTLERSSREKRHVADDIINDKYSKSVLHTSSARYKILAKLLRLVGSSPDTPCKCHLPPKHHSGSDPSKRDSQGHRNDPYFDCNCDMYSFIQYIRKRLSTSSGSSEGDISPLDEYVSNLSVVTKHRLAGFLNEEALRLKRAEIMRRLRRRRLQLQYYHRRRMLRKDPHLAFRGKQFLSF